ncbi:MAG: GxxExxY protein [Candidatus Pacebacteria bacterium]|nr:GxxExxY protein [Candidatus Paceibacterota bacterium]
MATENGENLLYEKESYSIRGACFDLYKKFGGAFKEIIINKALVSELKHKGLNIENQKRINIMHRGEKIGTYIPDIIVDEKILIELKVKPFITKEDDKQFWRYLKASNYKLGFLINFGSKKLEIKRRIYDKAREVSLHKSALISALICFYFISIGLLSPISTKANDQVRLMISPEIFELQFEKGEVYNGKIKIYNKGGMAMPMEAVVSNFDAEEISGTAVFYDDFQSDQEDDILFNSRKWIEIEKPNFILDPEETVNTKFTISVPENAEDGGYYTVIFFEPKVFSSGDLHQDESGVSVVQKIGTLLLISIGDRKKPIDNNFLTISEFSIPEKFHLKRIEDSVINITGLFSTAYAETIKTFSVVKAGELQFNLHIKNNDTYHIKPFGKLVVLSNSGKIIGETEIKKTTILPGKTRQIPVDISPEIPKIVQKLPSPLSNIISKNLFFGKYRALLTLNIEDVTTEEEIEFWIFPWKLFLIVVFILAIFILIRKRIRKAIKVLIKR